MYSPDFICSLHKNDESLTIAALLSGFFSPNILSMNCSNNKIKCGCLNAVSFTTLDSIPKILILHLKRFKVLPSNFLGNSNVQKSRFVLSKINTNVVLSSIIDMGFVSSESAIEDFSKLKQDFLRNELISKDESKVELDEEIVFDDIAIDSSPLTSKNIVNEDLNISIDKYFV